MGIAREWEKGRGRENEMESERKIERDPHKLEGEASTDHPRVGLTLKLDELFWPFLSSRVFFCEMYKKLDLNEWQKDSYIDG